MVGHHRLKKNTAQYIWPCIAHPSKQNSCCTELNVNFVLKRVVVCENFAAL